MLSRAGVGAEIGPRGSPLGDPRCRWGSPLQKLLILDEPSQGLAPLIVQEVFRVVTAARREGIAILLVKQNVRAATEIADRSYVLEDGRVVFSGRAVDFARDEQRVRALAGASADAWSAAAVNC
jgi:branched-chain amino acid transport system ATP-binding protein